MVLSADVDSEVITHWQAHLSLLIYTRPISSQEVHITDVAAFSFSVHVHPLSFLLDTLWHLRLRSEGVRVAAFQTGYWLLSIFYGKGQI